jgi:uncharacterized membrane protein YdjX (TVP38/TMEM64 family)
MHNLFICKCVYARAGLYNKVREFQQRNQTVIILVLSVKPAFSFSLINAATKEVQY